MKFILFGACMGIGILFGILTSILGTAWSTLFILKATTHIIDWSWWSIFKLVLYSLGSLITAIIFILSAIALNENKR